MIIRDVHAARRLGNTGVIAVLLLVRATAADWPQYRGPNHDGVSAEVIRTNWNEQAPAQVWKVPLDPGLSSLTVGGGRVYTQVRRATGGNQQEYCIALDRDSGAELWATPVGIARYPEGGVGSDDGPRSTPVVDADRVYVTSSYLGLFCLDAADGHVFWSRDFVAELGSWVILWENAASPVVVGDQLFLNCNSPGQCLVALNKNDGTILWKGQNDVLTQASPVYASVAGVPQVIFLTQSSLISVAPSDGTVLWRYPFRFSTSTAASPVVGGDLVYCSAAYGVGAAVVQVAWNGTSLSASRVWDLPGANMNHWATPVVHEGFLYGIYGQSLTTLRCVEMSTGEEKWRQGGVDTGAILKVNDLLLVTTGQGAVILVKPDPAAYRELGRFQAVAGKCWNSAAISDGRIYIRSTTQGAAFDVATPNLPPPRLKVQPAGSFGPEGFQLVIGTENGSPIDAARADEIQIVTSSNLDEPVHWAPIDLPRELVDGQLRIQDTQGLNVPVRMYRASEPR